jgi:hypothetical protein
VACAVLHARAQIDHGHLAPAHALVHLLRRDAGQRRRLRLRGGREGR